MPRPIFAFSRASLWMVSSLLAVGGVGCQSSPKVPPPGESPQAVTPVAVGPLEPAPAPILPGEPNASGEPNAKAAFKPNLPGSMAGAVKTHALATTHRAQVAIAGLGGGKGKVHGNLVLTELPDGGVQIEGVLVGLTPGKHGFHVHEHGDCSASDGMSAGGHFNPTKAPHGAHESTDSHVGDLGNLVADGQGRAMVSLVKKPATLGDGPSSFLGRAFIVHGGADDLTSQPAGESGARVGCGVIKPMS